MRPLVTLTTWLCLAVVSPASATDCGLIQDPDRRHMCYALADESSSQCGLISDSDLRHYCYGVVDKSSSQCGLISVPDLRRQIQYRCHVFRVSRLQRQKTGTTAPTLAPPLAPPLQRWHHRSGPS